MSDTDGRHKWALTMVLPMTSREAHDFLARQRKVYKSLDVSDVEQVRVRIVVCYVCGFRCQEPSDMLAIPCPGEKVY